MNLKNFLAATASCLSAAATLHAQAVKVLHVFPFAQSDGTVSTNSDGTSVTANLVASGDTLFGTASAAGPNGFGTVFSMASNGSNFTVLHAFAKATGSPSTNADGGGPQSALVLSGRTLYGAAQVGGRGGWGTVFSLETNGANFTVLHAFTNHLDGAWPWGNLLLSDGTLYGTTSAGGAGLGVGNGTVFSMSTNGSNFIVLHAFTGSPDGQNPMAGLALSGGTLYGTTQQGGTNGFGTVFSVGTNGADYTRLRSFTNSPDGHGPQAGVVVLGNTLYGTAAGGGSNNNGVVYSLGTNGANYSILHWFTNNPDGSNPRGELVLSNGRLFGITGNGGTNGTGAVYSIGTSGGDLTVLHSYTFVFDGFFPYGGLAAANHAFYGSSSQGGGGGGTILSLSLPLTPIVLAVPIRNVDGSVTVNFSGASNTTYLVQAATNISPTVTWLNVATNLSAADGTWQYTDTNVISNRARFFRAVLP